MAPIVWLRLFNADGDFNQAAPHPDYPVKCRTSTQRTQAPESVGTPKSLPPLTQVQLYRGLVVSALIRIATSLIRPV